MKDAALRLLRSVADKCDSPNSFWASLLNQANGNSHSCIELITLAGLSDKDIIHVYNQLKGK